MILVIPAALLIAAIIASLVATAVALAFTPSSPASGEATFGFEGDRFVLRPSPDPQTTSTRVR